MHVSTALWKDLHMHRSWASAACSVFIARSHQDSHADCMWWCNLQLSHLISYTWLDMLQWNSLSLCLPFMFLPLPRSFSMFLILSPCRPRVESTCSLSFSLWLCGALLLFKLPSLPLLWLQLLSVCFRLSDCHGRLNSSYYGPFYSFDVVLAYLGYFILQMFFLNLCCLMGQIHQVY